eukprot:1950103-Alexandrium_andersonii.AAC.1
MLGRQEHPVDLSPSVAVGRAPGGTASAGGNELPGPRPALKSGSDLDLALVARLPEVHVEVARDNPGALPPRQPVE